MTASGLLIGLLLLLLGNQAPYLAFRCFGRPVPDTAERESRKAALRARSKAGGEQYRSGNIALASETFQSGYLAAKEAGEDLLAARFLANFGSCRLALHDYTQALDAFRRARELALSAGDFEAAGALDSNISSLYAQMGEVETAAHWIEHAMERLSRQDSRHSAKAWVQMGTLRARQGRMSEAIDAFRRGVDGADLASDWDTYAIAWDRLGEEYFNRGELDAAENAALEAWRIRRLRRLGALDSSLRNLARICLARGDLATASALLDEAVERLPSTRGLNLPWEIYHLRGKVRTAQGRYEQALEDLRIAIRLARVWRLTVPPDDAARIGTEGRLQQVYTALIDAGTRQYEQNHEPALVRETFVAAEENRALSLRALLSQLEGWQSALPPTYWEDVARLQVLELENIRSSRPGLAEETQNLRARLAQMEDNAGTTRPIETADLAERARTALGADTALFSFHLGQTRSYLWVATRDGFEFRLLPPRKEVAASVARYLDGLHPAESEDLYRLLFGQVPQRAAAKARWLLALDEDLFQVPFAALIAGKQYLVERHEIQVISGAAMLAGNKSNWTERLRGPFLGVGDPVYNRADARWQGVRNLAKTEWVLPRLPGTLREVEACGAVWGAGTGLLTGPDASKQRLREALRQRPAVLHLATHVLASAGRPKEGLVMLSLRPDAGPDVLGPREIAAWQAPAGLVTLSGCAAGDADALPGSGLMGMTRAWLAAGAGAVVATRWATPDDTGTFFRAFYRRLREATRAGPAAALARAQVDMIHDQAPRSDPRFWGGFFMVANQ